MASKAEVIGTYKSVLGRDPYESELAPGGWVDKWSKSGLSASQLANKFYGSDEYKSKTSSGGGSATGQDQGYGTMSDFVSDYNAKYQALLEKQKAEQEGKFKEYKGAIAGQESMGSAYARLSGEAGIPGLKEESGIFKGEMYKIKDLIDQLEEDIYSRTKGSFTTEAQSRSMLAKEGSNLENQLGRLGTAYTPIREQLMSAEEEVTKRLGFLSDEQQKQLRPLELEISMTSDRFAREITGFTESKQVQLTGILDKIQRQRELDDREWELAQTLAAEERAWAQEKEKMAIEQRNSMASSGYYNQTLADAVNKQTEAIKAQSAKNVAGGKTAEDLFGISDTGSTNWWDYMSGTPGQNLGTLKTGLNVLKNRFF